MSERKTKRKKAEKKNPEKAAAPILDPQHFRANLLALVSHELNTPLTGILNAITVLEETYPEDQDYLPMLRRNADRLRRTVENMLTLADADAGILRVHLSEIALENVIRLEVEKLHDYLEKAKFEVELEIESDLPSVCADPGRLRRVLITFIENAVKFSRPGTERSPGKVHVTLDLVPVDELEIAGDMKHLHDKTALFAVVTVSSSQAPLAPLPESYTDFFEPFSPWRDVYTREKEGLGVELALAREIVIAHHGFIDAGPPLRQDEGCVFRFGLPILSRQDELEYVINNRLQGSLGSLSKTSVLILHPDPETLATVGDLRMLEEQVKSLLYRSSDSVFGIPSRGEITIIMDDCNARGAEKLAERLVEDLRKRLPKLSFVYGTATGPDDGSEAKELLEHAALSWRPV